MKNFIALLSLLIYALVGSEASARCRSGSVWSTPGEDKRIPSNGSVIFTFSGKFRVQISKSMTQTFFFESESISSGSSTFSAKDEKIEAILVRRWVSEENRTALQFKPIRPLIEGKSYSLEILDHRSTWKVGPADTTTPFWSEEPELFGFHAVRYGCGWSMHFLVDLDVTDESPIFYDAVLETEGKRQNYYVQSYDGRAWIGHGMCGGKFELTRGKRTLLELTPYDLSGNRGAPIWVTIPATESDETDSCVEKYQCQEKDHLMHSGYQYDESFDSWAYFQWNGTEGV